MNEVMFRFYYTRTVYSVIKHPLTTTLENLGWDNLADREWKIVESVSKLLKQIAM